MIIIISRETAAEDIRSWFSINKNRRCRVVIIPRRTFWIVIGEDGNKYLLLLPLDTVFPNFPQEGIIYKQDISKR